MSRTHIELSGLAVSWQAFTTPEGERQQFAPESVDAWISRPGGERVPIMVNHKPETRLPVDGRVNLRLTDEGLEFDCRIKRTADSELFEVALASSHFRGCSVTWDRSTTQRRGDVRRITSCNIEEISVCDWPQNAATWARVSGELGVWCNHLSFLQHYLDRVDNRPFRPYVPRPQTSVASKQPPAPSASVKTTWRHEPLQLVPYQIGGK